MNLPWAELLLAGLCDAGADDLVVTAIRQDALLDVGLEAQP